MSIAKSLGHLAVGRPLSVIQEDIRREFDFHIEAVADELVGQGWNEVEAKQEAERRFGNQETILNECQSIQTGRLVWWTRISLAGGVLSLLIIGSLAYFSIALVNQNRLLTQQLEATNGVTSRFAGANITTSPTTESMPNSPEPAGALPIAEPTQIDKKEKLRGKVTNAEGKPIANAKVVLIHKSWPNSRFQMENDVTKTDKEGNYEFDDLYSMSGENQFLVTIFAEGHEMRSEYISIKAKKKSNAIDFRLKPAKTIAFQVLGPDKKPLAETDVVLLKRKVGTKEHMLYPASVEDAKLSTDDKGILKVSFLNEGDSAEFGVLIFGEIQSVEVKVSSEAEQVIVVQKKR